MRQITRTLATPSVAGFVGNAFAGTIPPCRYFRLVCLGPSDLPIVQLLPQDWPAGWNLVGEMNVATGAPVATNERFTLQVGQLVRVPESLEGRTIPFTAIDAIFPHTSGIAGGIYRPTSLCIATFDFIDEDIWGTSHDALPPSNEGDGRRAILLANWVAGVIPGSMTSNALYLGRDSSGGASIQIVSPGGALQDRAGTFDVMVSLTPDVDGFVAVPALTAPLVATVALNVIFDLVNVRAPYAQVAFTDGAGGAGVGTVTIRGSANGRLI